MGEIFNEYKANFDSKRSALRFPPGTVQKGVGCESKRRPRLPPWQVDWAVLFNDGKHFRVRESWTNMSHPNYDLGCRVHFGYQYGVTNDLDEKGMPRSADSEDTILRVDNHPPFGPHIHYDGKNHVLQDEISGNFCIADAEICSFIDAVMTHRHSRCPLDEILEFKLRKGAGR